MIENNCIVDARLSDANKGLIASGVILLSVDIVVIIVIVYKKVKTKKGQLDTSHHH